MKPVWRRTPAFFAAASFLIAGSSLAFPALAQTQISQMANTNMVMISLPLIIGAGALFFAGLVIIWLSKIRNVSLKTQKTGQSQIASMRVKLDEYEAAFSCLPEVTVLWTQSGEPQMFGKSSSLIDNNPDQKNLDEQDMQLKQFLEFERWLAPKDAAKLNAGLRHLHLSGEGFVASVTTNSGQQLRAAGETNGGTAILHMRAVTAATAPQIKEVAQPDKSAPNPDFNSIHQILNLLDDPAWIRGPEGKITFANSHYLSLCSGANLRSGKNQFPELFSPTDIAKHQSALDKNSDEAIINEPLLEVGYEHELVLSRIGTSSLETSLLGTSSIGLIRKTAALENQSANNDALSFSNINPVLDAMTSPMVAFDKERRLKQFNGAYKELFSLDEKSLAEGTNEREVLDLLRRKEQLPAEPDYKEWRTKHLQSYALKKPRKELWHLASGRTLQVIATPNSHDGGVIYVFDDISEQLKLQSSNNAILVVQRETLNSLSEGVAVFGTDGRLRLHNRRLSSIWKLPINELGQAPHIDAIAQSCGKTIPEDGEEIWQRLKQSVVDFDPGRIDKSGRIKRKDGRLIDYAIVRLPDTQTLLTFVDVTKSANYETVLKERNEALETADRLKDAFVQNVSHELRVPLTSIIGFADLLASNSFGPLNEQQRTYTDYIRSSTATLGTLIDNILDLTNVDAGIARLDLKELDIASLIEKAKTGFSATLVGTDGATPINLLVNMPEPAPKLVADGNRVVQILYNLLSNAVKYSDPGSKIILDVEENAGWIRLSITDQGIAVPSELKAALEKPDQGRSLKELHRNSGIGLTIVKAFVELHGGNITMQTNPANGNTIIVNLPADVSKLIDQPASK
ncbi:FIG056333: sensor [hydrothermal vent metagenome]|uniref:histidine kinase n=1 Tax=hydrothermal vent metagenome TaxID=652676 RepID=A0A3B0U2Z4_9ZZZZ